MRQHSQLPRLSAFIAIALMSLLAACSNASATPTTGNTSPDTITTSANGVNSTLSVPLKVTSVDISLSIPTVSTYTCGTNITEIYTATFHFPANNAGGQVKFAWTTNNGRASSPATLSVKPGQTSATYAFNWTGQTSADNTVPGRGGVMVTAPNAYTSALVAPTGACTTAAATPLKVTSVDIGLSIPSMSKYTCGTNITETYTATFHFPANNAGGQVVFAWTTNNGRASSAATLAVSPGQTSATYAFNWTGQASADNTVPGRGGVMVTAPNAYISALIAPAGACTPVAATPFKVTSIGLSAGPEVTAHRCGSAFTENYTATFHIAAGGPGGTIVFQYTTNNGRASGLNVSLHVAAGQTTATYVFKWSGSLTQDHTAPGVGIVMVSAPNQLISPSAVPEGGCTNM